MTRYRNSQFELYFLDISRLSVCNSSAHYHYGHDDSFRSDGQARSLRHWLICPVGETLSGASLHGVVCPRFVRLSMIFSILLLVPCLRCASYSVPCIEVLHYQLAVSVGQQCPSLSLSYAFHTRFPQRYRTRSYQASNRPSSSDRPYCPICSTSSRLRELPYWHLHNHYRQRDQPSCNALEAGLQRLPSPSKCRRSDLDTGWRCHA